MKLRVAVLLMLFSGCLSATLAVRQDKACSNATPGTSFACTFNSNVVSGNFIFYIYTTRNGDNCVMPTASTLTDTLSTTYTYNGKAFQPTGANVLTCAASGHLTSGGADTVTFATSGAAGPIFVWMWEVSGMSGIVSNTGSTGAVIGSFATSYVTPGVTSASNTNVFICAAANSNSSPVFSITVTGGNTGTTYTPAGITNLSGVAYVDTTKTSGTYTCTFAAASSGRVAAFAIMYVITPILNVPRHNSGWIK